MSSSDKGWIVGILAIAFGAALVISSIAWPIAWYNKNVLETAMKEGYEQAPRPGAPGTIWVKREKQ